VVAAPPARNFRLFEDFLQRGRSSSEEKGEMQMRARPSHPGLFPGAAIVNTIVAPLKSNGAGKIGNAVIVETNAAPKVTNAAIKSTITPALNTNAAVVKKIVPVKPTIATADHSVVPIRNTNAAIVYTITPFQRTDAAFVELNGANDSNGEAFKATNAAFDGQFFTPGPSAGLTQRAAVSFAAST
jgi:hypothetical protein